MFSACNVDGKCDVSSGLVSKLISVSSETCNEVSDFGSCSRRFLENLRNLPKSNLRIEAGRRGTNKSRPSNDEVATNDSKDGSVETNEVLDYAHSRA